MAGTWLHLFSLYGLPSPRKARRGIFFLCLATFPSACISIQSLSFWGKFEGRPEGLRREQVTERIGEPAESRSDGAEEILRYRNPPAEDAYFFLRDGKVVDHGTLSIYERAERLFPGMPRAKVEMLLGKPNLVERQGVRDVLVYWATRDYVRFRASQTVDFHVVCEDDRLVKLGDVYRTGFEHPPDFRHVSDWWFVYGLLGGYWPKF